MLDFFQKLNGARAAGDALQDQFTPDWLLRTGAAALKRWFLAELAKSVDVTMLTEEWNATSRPPKDEAQWRDHLNFIFDHVRRKY